MMARAAEIERKFLLESRPAGLEAHPRRRIVQGYVAVDGAVEVRIRRSDGETTLTVKSGSGLSRGEVEVALGSRQYGALTELVRDRKIVKTRHLVPLAGGLTAEVDEFHEGLDGLWTAEVEFSSEAAAARFDPPAWLGREITGDRRYANRELATRGRPA
jgi:adenylate cyclase